MNVPARFPLVLLPPGHPPSQNTLGGVQAPAPESDRGFMDSVVSQVFTIGNCGLLMVVAWVEPRTKGTRYGHPGDAMSAPYAAFATGEGSEAVEEREAIARARARARWAKGRVRRMFMMLRGGCQFTGLGRGRVGES